MMAYIFCARRRHWARKEKHLASAATGSMWDALMVGSGLRLSRLIGRQCASNV